MALGLRPFVAHPTVGTLCGFIFQKSILTEGKSVAQGCTASERECWDLDPCTLTPKPALLAIT